MKQNFPQMLAKQDSRPEILPLFVAFFIVGLQSGSICTGNWYLLFGALTAGGLGLSYFPLLRGYGLWIPLAMAAIGVGGLNGALRSERIVPPETFAEFDGSRGALEGVFVGEFKVLKKGGISFVMENARYHVASQAIDLPGRVRFHANSHELLPDPGQCYRGEGIFRSISGRKMPEFDCEDFRTVGLAFSPWRLIGGIQRALRDRITMLLPTRHQALLLAFLLGDTSGLQLSDKKLFQRTGATHLMAVSGQNILVVVCFLAAVLTWIQVPPLSRGLLVISALVVYCFLTVGNSSVWRAMAMYLVGVVAVNTEADPGPIRPLALTALLLLLLHPPWLFNIGFQLSFMAVFGIVLGRLPIERKLSGFGMPLLLARYLAISFAANFATLPLIAFHFGSVSLASFVANPLLVWTFSVILPVGMLLPIFGGIWESFGVIVGSGLSLFLDMFLSVLDFCGALPYALVSVGEIPGIAVAIVYAVMLAMVSPAGSWRKSSEQKPGEFPEPIGKKPAGIVSTPGSVNPSPPGQGTFTPRVNPFVIPELVEAIDQQLAIFPKRSLKGQGQFETVTFPWRSLSMDGQTLYHRIDDLSREVLQKEPDRLLQAQVFLIALLGSELVARMIPRLDPPPTPADISVKLKVKSRYLAMALISDGFFLTALPGRTNSEELARLIGDAQKLHIEARNRLLRFTRSRCPEDVTDFLEGRSRVLAWLKDSANLSLESDPQRPSSKKL